MVPAQLRSRRVLQSSRGKKKRFSCCSSCMLKGLSTVFVKNMHVLAGRMIGGVSSNTKGATGS